MSVEFRVGDVFDRLAEIEDGSIDLIVSSPPFLALRSYLPDDHPDKHREIGSEPSPAAFIATHLELAAEYARVLAPHGSLCYEIGDTYSGSGGAGGDYGPTGLRAGQPEFDGSQARTKSNRPGQYGTNTGPPRRTMTDEWPLSKSMCLVPHMFTGSLAYGRNLLTGEVSPAGEWRIRNVICWARPNPPVGALGDKFRPATSYITVACKSDKRWFDLDAVRTVNDPSRMGRDDAGSGNAPVDQAMGSGQGNGSNNPGGAPPLDWHTDGHPEDGDWLWKLSTAPYKGAHFATFPMVLPKRLIEAMCPRQVCRVCGTPRTRITEHVGDDEATEVRRETRDMTRLGAEVTGRRRVGKAKVVATGDWTDCGHDDYRTGVVLDPFAGSGTTLEAAQIVGRHAIGIDLDERNAELARGRVGMFMQVVGG